MRSQPLDTHVTCSRLKMKKTSPEWGMGSKSVVQVCALVHMVVCSTCTTHKSCVCMVHTVVNFKNIKNNEKV